MYNYYCEVNIGSNAVRNWLVLCLPEPLEGGHVIAHLTQNHALNNLFFEGKFYFAQGGIKPNFPVVNFVLHSLPKCVPK